MSEPPPSSDPTPWASIIGFGVFAAIPLVMHVGGSVTMTPNVSHEGFANAIILFFANIGMLVAATILALVPRTRRFGKGALLASGLTLMVVLANCARYL